MVVRPGCDNKVVLKLLTISIEDRINAGKKMRVVYTSKVSDVRSPPGGITTDKVVSLARLGLRCREPRVCLAVYKVDLDVDRLLPFPPARKVNP